MIDTGTLRHTYIKCPFASCGFASCKGGWPGATRAKGNLQWQRAACSERSPLEVVDRGCPPAILHVGWLPCFFRTLFFEGRADISFGCAPSKSLTQGMPGYAWQSLYLILLLVHGLPLHGIIWNLCIFHFLVQFQFQCWSYLIFICNKDWWNVLMQWITNAAFAPPWPTTRDLWSWLGVKMQMRLKSWDLGRTWQNWDVYCAFQTMAMHDSWLWFVMFVDAHNVYIYIDT